ncbi:MAG: 3-oxoacyl-[acyl-carrier-protein] synthase III C-terminal domain-containing protein [Salinivirgaceae bacterium]
MTKLNYIFKGFGHAAGKYKVTNAMLEEAVAKNMIEGFNPDMIKQSKNYQAYNENNPDTTPLGYFVGHKMGFYNRNHVTPWPPIKQNQDVAENSLDLLIEAVQKTLDNAGLDAEDIDGWIVSTVSPQEQAPGIATTLKCYFTAPENKTPAMTLTSGCAGFNIALRRSLDYFKSRSDIKNILIANTETMSHFLNHKRDFVYHATFGDAAAAAVISQVPENGADVGVGAIVNYQDLRMIDFVGVDKEWNLYMDGPAVKRRAVPNLISSSKEVMERVGWTIDDIDLIVPHQTGNAILHSVAEEMNVPLAKLYQDAQHVHGNVSGTTIPIALSMLQEEGRLKPGMKLLCPTAGVGGEYGAWTYVVPQSAGKKAQPKPAYQLIKDESLLFLFADNLLGVKIAEKLINTDVQCTFHCANENEYQQQFNEIAAHNSNIKVVSHTINNIANAQDFIDELEGEMWHSVVNLGFASETIYGIDNFDDAQDRLQAPFSLLSKKLLLQTKKSMVFLSHPMELFSGADSLSVASSANGCMGIVGSMSGEAISRGVRSIWYVPAVYDQLTHYMSMKLKIKSMKAMRQARPYFKLDRLADNIIKSTYLLKVPQTIDKYKGVMIYRKEACAFRQAE